MKIKQQKQIKEFIIKNLKWIILFICLIGFFALAEDVFNKEIMDGDIIGYKLISKLDETPCPNDTSTHSVA